MEFTVAERVMVGNILPNFRADVLSLRVAQDLIKEFGFDANEQEEFAMRTENGMTFWDSNLAHPKDIHINRRSLTLLRKALNQAFDDDQLNVAYLPIYDRMTNQELQADE